MKYEYKFISAIGSFEEVTKTLNGHGEEGWDIQLTGFKSYPNNFKKFVFEGFAKRKI